MQHDLNQFIAGAIFLGELLIATLFARFWWLTRDRLFAWFATAFGLLAIERVLLFWNMSGHDAPLVYVTRLLAFASIIIGVIERNRRAG